jgi:CubicO group peptidase (beta-lactamase class C family)
MNTFRALLTTGFVSLCLIGCSSSEKLVVTKVNGKKNYDRAIQESHKFIEKLMNKTGTVGMAVAVIDSNDVVYSEGFGYSDIELQRKTDDTTIFRTGSMGKLFTAIAIMQLVEKGKVCLDSPITDYIPEFTIKSRFNARQITIRDLLTHESGLPSDILNGSASGQCTFPGLDTTYRDAVTGCANEYMANPPCTAWSYSNLGFALLGSVIERTSKCTFINYVQDSIFSRLRMNHSYVGIDSVRKKSNFSKGYFGKTSVEPVYISRNIPSGDMVTSTADMAQFIRMLFSNGSLNGNYIISNNTLEKMLTPQNSKVALDFRKQGLCFWLTNLISSSLTYIPEKIAIHGGACPPFHTYLAILPEVKLGIVVLVNSDQGSGIHSQICAELLEFFYQAKKGQKIIEPQPINEPVVKLSPGRLQELAGYYFAYNAGSYVGTVKAEINGTALSYDFSGTKAILIPHSDSTFSLQRKLFGLIPLPLKDLKNIRLEFHTIAGRQLIVFYYNKYHMGIIAEKFIPETPSDGWLSRVGSYEIVNEEKAVFTDSISENYYRNRNFDLSYDSTTKILSFFNFPLKILSTDDAITSGIGRFAGETVHAYNENGNEYLWYSGYALKRK